MLKAGLRDSWRNVYGEMAGPLSDAWTKVYGSKCHCFYHITPLIKSETLGEHVVYFVTTV